MRVGEERNLTTKEMISINFSFICSNIPTVPAYGVYISQMIRYSRACGFYQDFFDRGLLLTRKLLNQGFLLVKLKSSLRKFYGRHYDLINRYEHLYILYINLFMACHVYAILAMVHYHVISIDIFLFNSTNCTLRFCSCLV